MSTAGTAFTDYTQLTDQVRFSFAAVFHESTEFIRNYTCPFNMISVCIRAEGANASRSTNLLTGKVREVRENDISMVPYNLPQQYHHTLRHEHLAIHFRLELFPGVDVFMGRREVYLENSPVLRREAEEIFADTDPVRKLSRCQIFAMEYALRHWPERYPFDIKEIEYFSPVLDYIESSADGRTRISDLAGIMHKADSTFTRDFHKCFGMAPKQFLQQQLYNKAARLLLIPKITVKRVAEQMGFESEFYFSHFFKRMSGVAPREFQRDSIFNRSFSAMTDAGTRK